MKTLRTLGRRSGPLSQSNKEKEKESKSKGGGKRSLDDLKLREKEDTMKSSLVPRTISAANPIPDFKEKREKRKSLPLQMFSPALVSPRRSTILTDSAPVPVSPRGSRPLSTSEGMPARLAHSQENGKVEKEKEKEDGEPIVYVTVPDISKRKTRQASKGYQAIDSREISFEQGDLLLIFDADESGWCEGALLIPSLSAEHGTYRYGKVGWFPLSCIPPLDQSRKAPAPVETSSIVNTKGDTSNKLASFLNQRPSEQELRNRNILPETASTAVSPQVAAAQKELMTKNKRIVLGNLLSFSHLKKASRKSSMPTSPFGMDFKELLRQEGNTWPAPYLFYQCTEHLRQHSLATEGLFRISASFVELEDLKKQFKLGIETVDLTKYESHAISNLMKAYLRELPESLITWDVAEQLKKHMGIQDPKEKNALLDSEMEKLPNENKAFLNYLFEFLHQVQQHSDISKMTSSNLAIVFTPSLIVPKVMSVENLANQTLVQLVVTFIEAGSILLS